MCVYYSRLTSGCVCVNDTGTIVIAMQLYFLLTVCSLHLIKFFILIK